MEPSRNRPELTEQDRRRLLEQLVAAETFDQFLHAKFVSQKRFSLEAARR
jgi:2-oxoglutarate dehydrogenase E1 component